MRVTLNIYPGAGQQDQLLNIEIFPDMSVATLRDSIEAETRIPQSAQHIYHNGALLADQSKTMEQLAITDGEMLAVHVRRVPPPPSGPGRPGAGSGAQVQAQPGRAAPGGPAAAGAGNPHDPEMIRLNVLGNPAVRQQLQQMQPRLAAVLEDPVRFAQVLRERQNAEQTQRLERQREIERLNADPFDLEAQAKIEEMIRQEQVSENLQAAMEHNPEVFGRVHMLYLDVEVHGHKIKAMVDSGAQATVMSPSCAEACGIMRLIDKRFSGIAYGVGTAAILGRVHSAQIRIGSLFLACSFTVMEGKDVDLLLGLDMLKRYQACIDLAKDTLIIHGESIPFLGEADIPKEMRQATKQEPTIPGPSGTSIGQHSGAILPSESSQHPSRDSVAAAVAAAAAPTSAQPLPSTSSSDNVASSAAAAAAAPAPAPSPYQPSAEKIEQLVSMGASREAAIHALQAAGGNVEVAANFIFFES